MESTEQLTGGVLQSCRTKFTLRWTAANISLEMFCTLVTILRVYQVTALTDTILCVINVFPFLFFFSFVLAELEFVQIIIIIVVITVMVVVIICLLNHYKLSTRSFINRQSQSRRQEETLQTVSTSLVHPTLPSCVVWGCSKAS